MAAALDCAHTFCFFIARSTSLSAASTSAVAAAAAAAAAAVFWAIAAWALTTPSRSSDVSVRRESWARLGWASAAGVAGGCRQETGGRGGGSQRPDQGSGRSPQRC